MRTPPPDAKQRCDNLPHPISVQYFRFSFRNFNDLPGPRADIALTLTETTIRYLALLSLVAFQRDNLQSDLVDEHLKKLAKPSLGTWIGLFREILKFYQQNAHLSFPVPELLIVCQEKLGAGPMTSAMRSLNKMNPAIRYVPDSKPSVVDFLQFMVVFRNAYAHGGIRDLPDKELTAYVDPIEAALDELIGRLQPLTSSPLIAFAGWAGNRMIYDRLIGNSSEFEQGTMRWTREEDPKGDDVFLPEWAGDTPHKVTSVFPFALHRHCPECRGKRFFLLNGGYPSDKSYQYISKQCGHSYSVSVKMEEEIVGELPNNNSDRDAVGVPPVEIPPEKAAPEPEPISLSFRVMVDLWEDKQQKFVTRQGQSPQSLVSGDLFQIIVRLSRGAHFGLGLLTGQKQWDRIFPLAAQNGNTFLDGEREYVFPAASEFYALDDCPGTETICFFASDEPLGDVMAMMQDAPVEERHTRLEQLIARSGAPMRTRPGRTAISAGRTDARPVKSVEEVVKVQDLSGILVQTFEIVHR